MTVGVLNRVGMLIQGSPGQGSLTADTLISNKFNTPAEAGAVDGQQYYWMLEQGNDYEIFIGTWTLSGTVVSRDTVIESKISGTHGTTKLTIASGATLRSPTPKEALVTAWKLIEQQTVSSPVADVTFDNIPQGYSDLLLLVEGVSPSTTATIQFKTSADGSSFTSASLATGALSAGQSADCVAHVVGYSLDVSQVSFGFVDPVLSANTLEALGSAYLVALARHTGGMHGVQVLASTGNIDAGTLKLFGR